VSPAERMTACSLAFPKIDMRKRDMIPRPNAKREMSCG
jgi:hypothetical protein